MAAAQGTAAAASATQLRMLGVTVAKGFVYGTTAVWLGAAAAPNQATHKWTAYVKGLETELNCVRKVVFVLHPSFENPTRTVTSAPFEIFCEGWGEFEMQIFVHFKDAQLKPIELRHNLVLYQLDENGQQVLSKAPVVREVYDEFVFDDPTMGFYHKLALPGQLDPVLQTKYALEEQQQLALFDVVRRQIDLEITRLYDLYSAADRDIKDMRDEVRNADG
eukprot:Amastigsp_a844851_9.p1 type:complete len:220 gc:universal Amastigsp_a844851_9:791-132(-)